MTISCWSPKGGSGTTVVTAALALVLARSHRTLAVDLSNDLATVFGMESEDDSRSDAQGGHGVEIVQVVNDRLQLLELVAGPAKHRLQTLHVAYPDRQIVVDGGHVVDPDTARALAQTGPTLIVLRACYVAVRRLVMLGDTKAFGIVVVDEPGRILRPNDIEQISGKPVVATIKWHPNMARLVDLGRMPQKFLRSLRPLVSIADELIELSEHESAEPVHVA